MTVRYWDHEVNAWAYGMSIWDGKELPMDNSGWWQREATLGGGSLEHNEYPTQKEMRGKCNGQAWSSQPSKLCIGRGRAMKRPPRRAA